MQFEPGARGFVSVTALCAYLFQVFVQMRGRCVLDACLLERTGFIGGVAVRVVSLDPNLLASSRPDTLDPRPETLDPRIPDPRPQT
eukprot:1999774-Rhodomonas_salina.3